MYCRNCGFEAADNAKFCTECGAPLREPAAPVPAAEPTVTVSVSPSPAWEAAPAAPGAPVLPPKRRYRGRLVLAVLSCLFLFVPTGIPSIVYAAKAIRLSDDGNATAAKRAAGRSTLFFFLSFLGNIFWNLLGLFLLIRKYG